MSSLTDFKFCFTSSRFILGLAFVGLIIFLKLGFWQIERAHEKQELMLKYKTEELKKPVSFPSQNSSLIAQYQPIKTRGYYLKSLFLLDNQHYKHEFGYDVIAPLLLENGRVVMVDRGFVTADPSRLKLPVIDIPDGLITILGSVYYPSKNSWVLGEAIERKNEKISIIEWIEPNLISHILHKSVYPFIIRLNVRNANGFVRDWSVVAMSPKRHYAYAIQWFSFAFIIIILLVYNYLLKKKI